MTNNRIVHLISYFSCPYTIISKEMNLTNKYFIFVCRWSHSNLRKRTTRHIVWHWFCEWYKYLETLRIGYNGFILAIYQNCPLVCIRIDLFCEEWRAWRYVGNVLYWKWQPKWTFIVHYHASQSEIIIWF